MLAWGMQPIKLSEIKEFIKLCLPLMAAFSAQKGMQFIDTLMMGWIGPDALAAGALGTSVFMTILVFCRGTLSALGVAIVHARGSGQSDEIQSLLHQAFYLALTISLPSMFIAWITPHFLSITDESSRVINNTHLLLQGLAWGIPGFSLFFVLREFVSAFARARIIMLVSGFFIPLTFAINYILIYGKFGFPALGIGGIGYGGAAIVWLMFFCLLFYCKTNKILKEHLSFKLTGFEFKKIKELFLTGVSSGMILVLDTGMFLIAAVMLGAFGVVALASYQIAMQCISTAYNLPLAVSVVTALQTGHALGAGNFSKAKHQIYLGLLIGIAIALVIALIFILFPGAIVKLFLGSKNYNLEIYHQTVTFLMIAVLFQGFDAAQAVLNGALRGFKDTFIPMLLNTVCYCLIGLGSAYIFGFHTPLQADGIWFGLTFGIFSLSLFLAIRLRKNLINQI